MKCKYTFPVRGFAGFPTTIVFSQGDRVYELETKDGLLASLSVTIANFPDAALPTLTPHAQGPIRASISIPIDPFWDQLVSDIRTIEGGLCFWGVREIDVISATRTWIPESDAEKEKLDLFSFNTSRKNRASEPSQVPVDLFVRTVLAVSHLKDGEAPLNFY